MIDIIKYHTVHIIELHVDIIAMIHTYSYLHTYILHIIHIIATRTVRVHTFVLSYICSCTNEGLSISVQYFRTVQRCSVTVHVGLS